MTCESSGDLKIHRGETFVQVLRWEHSPRVYKSIQNITKAGPCIITAEDHGMPDGWRITRINSVKGMTQINTEESKDGVWSKTKFGKEWVNGIPVRVIDDDTIELNVIDSSGYSSYSSGGLLSYNTPVELTGFTARAQFRASVDATGEPLFELTTENGGIVLDEDLFTISLLISADDSATLDNTITVASLEMISNIGVVTQLVKRWDIELCGEVTHE